MTYDPFRNPADPVGRLRESVTWSACVKCGAMTRHDNGICYRDTRHPRAAQLADAGQFTHTPDTPSFLERRLGR